MVSAMAFVFKKGFIEVYGTEVGNKKGDPLGHIEPHKRWKCEVFAVGDVVFSADCLRDIAAALDSRAGLGAKEERVAHPKDCECTYCLGF
jgi:hypothetical protein